MTEHNTTETEDRTPSDHDVYKEYQRCLGTQKIPLRDLFIHTMNNNDVTKITLQLINMQATEVCISVGDSYRRTLDKILWDRVFGDMSIIRR